MDLADVIPRIGQPTQGLVTWAQLRAAGVGRAMISRAVADGRIVRIHRRVYACSALPALPRYVVTEHGPALTYVAHVRAVLLSLGNRAAASSRTAAALWNWPMLVEPARTVDVAVDHGRDEIHVSHVQARQRRGAARVQRRVFMGDAPIWVTSAVQTVLDCALELPLVQAVVICDSALRAGDVSLVELQRAASSLPGVRNARRARRVLSLADPRSASVLESVLRVRLAEAGLTDVRSQVVLCDVSGHRILRVDFCFAAERLVVEVDGHKWHPDPVRDRHLDNLLAIAGWRVLRYTWAEVVHGSDGVVADIFAALGRGTSAVPLAGHVAA